MTDEAKSEEPRPSGETKRPSKPPAAPVPVPVQIADHAVDLCSVCVAGWLCHEGKIEGVTFLVFAGAVLGLQTSIRQFVGRANGTNVSGVVALLFAVGSAGLLHRVIVGAGLSVLVLGALGATGCSGSQVQQQAAAADVTAQALNRALPVWVGEYEREGREAIDAACCSRDAMEAALERIETRWRPVALAWESTRAAHDAWRRELERCRATPDQRCDVSVPHLAASVLASAGAWRCAVRVVGYAQLDPLSGVVACDGGDGGAR
jgi:hypothetical protein